MHSSSKRIGVGTEEDVRTLGEMGCDAIVSPELLVQAMDFVLSPVRAGDVVVVADPKLLQMEVIKWVADQGVSIEVVGNEPKIPQNYEERRQLRALKRNVSGENLQDVRGRPKVYEIAKANVQAAIEDWHAGEYENGIWRSKYTPAGIMERARLRTGLELPKHWARNAVIAEFGSAVRNPENLPRTNKEE